MKNLLGNEKILGQLEKIAKNGNFSHAYLFLGPGNIGKTEAARIFAKELLCEAEDKPCRKCQNCLLAEAGNHPDLLFKDGDEVVTVDEVRELIHFLELKPYQAKRKVAVIAHAERLTEQASNSLLKTLEEPAKNTVIIQTAENMQNLLDTIISRSQVVNFTQISSNQILSLVDGFELTDVEKDKVVSLSSGRPRLAVRLAEDREKREKLFNLIDHFDQIYFRGRVYEKITFAGEIASEKENLPELINLLEAYYRQKLVQDKENRLMVVHLLDKLIETKDLINKNINLQLAAESLLLAGEK